MVFILKEPVLMERWTWPAMSGNGCGIGMEPMTKTKPSILSDQMMVNTVCCVAAVGTTFPVSFVPHTGTMAIPRTRAIAWVFAVYSRRRRSVFCFLNSKIRGVKDVDSRVFQHCEILSHLSLAYKVTLVGKGVVVVC